MGSECLQFDDPKVFTLKDNLVDLHFPFVFLICSIIVNIIVKIVPVSMKVFACSQKLYIKPDQIVVLTNNKNYNEEIDLDVEFFPDSEIEERKSTYC